MKRIVVTGLGALTPIGNDVNSFWNALLEGKSGAGPITRFDASDDVNFKTKFACELKGFEPTSFMSKKELKRIDPFSLYALVVADQAVNDSQLLDYKELDLNRVGVIMGSGIGGLNSFEEEISEHLRGGRFTPFFIPKMIADLCAGHISIKYGFGGVNFVAVSACASGTNAIVEAMNNIRLGKADVIVTGGAEAVITASGVGGFNAIKALSERNDDPFTASRPFDKDRDGFVLGEGAGCLIIEEYEHALKRGAKIYAELVGGAGTADAYHMTAPHPEGAGARRVMELSIKDAGIRPDQIDHINTHGTSTSLGDVAEIKAVTTLFGDHAYKININSTKSMTGHLLGAAGAVEAIAAIMSTIHNVVPPTINQFERDPEIDPKLNLTANKLQEREINYALSNTFGFGGHNYSVIFKKYKA